MKAVSFKTAIEKLGYTIISLNKGYNYRSAFASDENRQLWYFSIEDLRDTHPTVFRRTAKSLNDFTGGVNQFDVESDLAELGFTIKEPRSKGDYNSA